MYGIELRKGRDCIKHKIFIFAAAPGLFVLTCLTGESWIIRIAAAAVGGLAARLIPLLLAGRREKIRSRSYDMDLPDLLIHIAMFTEAGLNLRDAVERAAGIGSLERPLYRDLNEIFERIRRGSAKIRTAQQLLCDAHAESPEGKRRAWRDVYGAGADLSQ